jgi:hypothetical protein
MEGGVKGVGIDVASSMALLLRARLGDAGRDI